MKTSLRKVAFAVLLGLLASPHLSAMEKKVVIVLTNHEELGETDKKTGAYLSEITHPYEMFENKGFEVILASPEGGEAPIDPKATDGPINEKYMAREAFKSQLQNTVKLSELSKDELGILFFAGGHGTMWDFPDSSAVQEAIRSAYEGGAIVAAVCHGPAAFVNVLKSDGNYLIDGKNVTGFTNSEEEAVELTQVMPFLLEDRMVDRGATFLRKKDFEENVVTDGRLVTGQNPSSAAGVAEAAIKALKEKS